MADWIRFRDSSRLVHYENDWTAAHSDIWSHMYTWLEEVDRIGRYEESFDGYGYQKGEVNQLAPWEKAEWAVSRSKKPFLLIEYGHAMGNGPGGLKEYQVLFESYKRLQGGSLWEWIDHALKQRDTEGRVFFAVGGDFGEARGTHGGNFVCDGLLYPDRTPSPALANIKAIIQPVSFELDGDQILVRNKYSFIDLSHLKFRWELLVGDQSIERGHLELSIARPGATIAVNLPAVAKRILATEGMESWLTISSHLEISIWDVDHEVAFAQLHLRASTPQSTTIREPLKPIVHDRQVMLGPATFDGDNGSLLSIGDTKVDVAQIDLWRAPTDNDKGGAMTANWPETRTYNLDQWLDAGLDRVQHQVTSVVLDTNQLVVTSQVGPAVLDRYLEVKSVFLARDKRTLSIMIDITPKGPWMDLELPRLGFKLQLDSPALDSVRWHGCGPEEAYPDTRSGARVGTYQLPIDKMQTPYITPQDNGTRLDVRYAQVLDESGKGLCFFGKPDFALAVRRWSTESLAAATRQTDLSPSDRVFVHVDRFVSGIGSASTGPGVHPAYVVRFIEEQTVHFAFDIQLVE